MSTPIQIKDGTGKNSKACVTSIGQVVTAPYDYDLTSFQELDSTSAFNFYPPIAGKQFVVTGLALKADRSVSAATAAIIIVFEAETTTDAVVANVLYQVALAQGESIVLLPMNLLVSKGAFINATTTDPTCFVNVFGYYIPEIS